MRSGIWRFAVAPSDAVEKTRNCTTIQSIPCINAPKKFWKIYFLYDLVRTNLFIPSRFSDYTDTKFDNLSRYIATCGKKFIYMHI